MTRPLAFLSSRRSQAAKAKAALRSKRGATALEFGLIASGLVLLMIAIIESALQIATGAALDWAALRASRFGITGAQTVRNQPPTGVPTCRSAMIPWLVTYATNGFLQSANLTVTSSIYSGLSGGRSGTGGSSGAGSGGAIVGYTLTYNRPFITPLATALLGRSQFTHTARLLVKNEPFDNATC